MNQHELPAPIEASGMTQVSKSEFYTKIGPLNVHPRIPGPWKTGVGYTSIWELQSGQRAVVGVSDGANRYWVSK